jgi:uncharacterized protein YkwD
MVQGSRFIWVFLVVLFLFSLILIPTLAAPISPLANHALTQPFSVPTALKSSLVLTFTPVATVYLPALEYSPAANPPTPGPTPSPTPPLNDWLAYVNYYRNLANVPAVTAEATLNDNCFQHARYMAENNHLTHNQNPNLPWASPAGQICAQKGNAWMGSAFSSSYWQPHHSIESWMGSVGHRLWLLYPTTPTFGYGFYTAATNRAGAALDVLSEANFSADTSYSGWPIRYPAPGQLNVPASAYPITLNWLYFGSPPTLDAATLTTNSGTPIAHTANTLLPVGHEGIQILPSANLPDNTIFAVTVTGSYEGTPFSYTWKFSTGDAPIP